MKGRWRDVRLVAQTVLITSATCFVLFYLFGERLPIVSSTADSAGAQGGESTEIDLGPAYNGPRRPAEKQQRGNRVTMPVVRSPLQPGTRFVVPVAGVARTDLIDSYQDSRGSGARSHEAIDILASVGTPVHAVAPGTVEKLFWSDLGGNTIYVRSPNQRRIYYYAHLDAYRAGLEEGQPVKAGDPLGTVGSTGNADPTAPHLHFAILDVSPGDNWSEGRPVNPYPLLSR